MNDASQSSTKVESIGGGVLVVTDSHDHHHHHHHQYLQPIPSGHQNPAAGSMAVVNVNLNNMINAKDSRWLQLEVCREYQRSKCSRSDTECKFAHPPANVEVQNGRVIACYDSIKVSARMPFTFLPFNRAWAPSRVCLNLCSASKGACSRKRAALFEKRAKKFLFQDTFGALPAS